jgi:hypothetical protein
VVGAGYFGNATFPVCSGAWVGNDGRAVRVGTTMTPRGLVEGGGGQRLSMCTSRLSLRTHVSGGRVGLGQGREGECHSLVLSTRVDPVLKDWGVRGEGEEADGCLGGDLLEMDLHGKDGSQLVNYA